MKGCEVLVVGAGPAGSTCAATLYRAGVDVLLLDRATFPRDKPCAGWITPNVISALDLSLDHYRATGRTLQTISAFRVGRINGPAVDITFDRAVSYGICRPEFDDYLLKRARLPVSEGTAVRTIRRRDRRWIANEAIEARVLIGAGGHFCPVAQYAAPHSTPEHVVVAREVEVSLSSREARSLDVPGERPELRFCEDLRGYGWICRKGDVVNVGLGREDSRDLPRHVDAFVATLDPRLRAVVARGRWRGHAYLLRAASTRPAALDGVLLVGDAAGLAHAGSGEGIGPAVESGTLAADAIIRARGDGAEAAAGYRVLLDARLPRGASPAWPRVLADRIAVEASRWVFSNAWMARRLVLERRFLHLVAAGARPGSQ